MNPATPFIASPWQECDQCDPNPKIDSMANTCQLAARTSRSFNDVNLAHYVKMYEHEQA